MALCHVLDQFSRFISCIDIVQCLYMVGIRIVGFERAQGFVRCNIDYSHAWH